MVAGFFGLDGIFVSKARNDTANSGQSASYSRVWGKNPNTSNTSFFGVTRVSGHHRIPVMTAHLAGGESQGADGIAEKGDRHV